MARIVGYIAASLDGFIADRNQQLGWLTKYDSVELGEHSYANFIAHIRTIVMGRATYDWIAANSTTWPYAGQRVIVVTSRPIEAPPASVETRSDVDALIAELRALQDGDVWMAGGGQLQMAFIERGALDEIEIYQVAELIGGGHPLFPPTGVRRSPELLSAKTVGPGMVRLHYRFG
jgi:dihydrofolate reductase